VKLTLVMLSTAALLRFETPGAGAYYLLSTCDGCLWHVEASGWNAQPVCVETTVPRDEAARMFRVEWRQQ
jgi:hypothetical protein